MDKNLIEVLKLIAVESTKGRWGTGEKLRSLIDEIIENDKPKRAINGKISKRVT